LPSVIGFWAVGEDFFPNSGIFLLGKSFFANSSGLGCWESMGLLAKPHFPVVAASFLSYAHHTGKLHIVVDRQAHHTGITAAKFEAFILRWISSFRHDLHSTCNLQWP
jgi:hypothetical protein